MNPEVINWTLFHKHIILNSSEECPCGIVESEDRVSSNSWKCQCVQSPKCFSGKWNCFLCSHLDSCLGEHGRVYWHKLCGPPAPIWTQVCHVAPLLPGDDRSVMFSPEVTLMNRKVCSLCRMIKACAMTYKAVNACVCLLYQVVITEEKRRQGVSRSVNFPLPGRLRQQLHCPIAVVRQDNWSSFHCQLL